MYTVIGLGLATGEKKKKKIISTCSKTPLWRYLFEAQSYRIVSSFQGWNLQPLSRQLRSESVKLNCGMQLGYYRADTNFKKPLTLSVLDELPGFNRSVSVS